MVGSWQLLSKIFNVTGCNWPINMKYIGFQLHYRKHEKYNAIWLRTYKWQLGLNIGHHYFTLDHHSLYDDTDI